MPRHELEHCQQRSPCHLQYGAGLCEGVPGGRGGCRGGRRGRHGPPGRAARPRRRDHLGVPHNGRRAGIRAGRPAAAGHSRRAVRRAAVAPRSQANHLGPPRTPLSLRTAYTHVCMLTCSDRQLCWGCRQPWKRARAGLLEFAASLFVFSLLQACHAVPLLQ